MLIGGTIANLHNLKMNRYHPIVFREAPQPSYKEGGLMRSKSIGHHSEGFDTREEAIEDCQRKAKEMKAELCIEKDFTWDGEGVPAMVVFFKKDEAGKVIPIIY